MTYVQGLYGKPEAGGERGEVMVLEEYTEEELRDFDFQVWQEYMKFRCEPAENITWENFIEWWLKENDGLVLRAARDV